MRKITTLLSATAAVMILAGCAEEAPQQQTEIIRPAKLIDITASTNEKTFRFPAVVEALSSKELTFQVPGQIETIRFREGQEVKQGEIIATLVQRSFNNDVETAQTQFDAAKLEFDRAERLIAENAIAQSIYDQRLTQLNVATAQLDSARKALEDTTLISPFDGVIAVKQAEELQTISLSQPIVTIQTEGAAEAMVKIPASLFSRAKQIEPLETVIMLDAAPEMKIPTQFVAATTIADERSQTFEVRFSFMPPEELIILPGMIGTVQSMFRLASGSESEGQITVPLHAVVTDSAGQFVWVVNSVSMTVSRRAITLGADVGENLIVESGLDEGETIVGAGASYLTEGMKIRRL